jgi:D-alanyl-D-alanine carboxypeptidase (penicillin-binding protein 5/6)
VVLDSPDMYVEAKALLDYGFATYRQRVYAQPGEAAGRARVKGGRKGSVAAVCEKVVACVAGPGLPEECRFEVKLTKVKAPLAKGAVVGEARLIAGDAVLSQSRLLAGEAVAKSRLIVFAVWALRTVLGLALLVTITRTYGKAVKARRRRRRRFAAQSRRPDPGGPRPG